MANDSPFVCMNDLKHCTQALDQELLLLQIEIHFEDTKLLGPLTNLLTSNWVNLELWVSENLDLISSIEHPNLSLHPKELAVLLEVFSAFKMVFSAYKMAGIPYELYAEQKLLPMHSMRKHLQNDYLNTGKIALELIPFAKWDEIIESEIIRRVPIALDLNLTKQTTGIFYLW